MTNRERLVNTINFKKSDRLPVVEWAAWWKLTVERWKKEGLDPELDYYGIMRYFGIDELRQIWIPYIGSGYPQGLEHGRGAVENEEDYEKYLPCLYPKDAVKWSEKYMLSIKEGHDRGDYAVWLTLNGFFWFPRVLLGIENHLYSFYDMPELYHRICEDVCNFNLRVIDEFCSIMLPDFMSIAEDMSYNNGPMLSEELFNEFIKPYYKRMISKLRSYNIKVFVDSDGDVTSMIPWLIDAGVDGVFPLERQAGVDINQIREKYPQFLLLGGFDKMVMKHGEAAMRAEFERILPVMRQGGYIPSVDHQTPPEVSLENYKIYAKLLKEYAYKAME